MAAESPWRRLSYVAHHAERRHGQPRRLERLRLDRRHTAGAAQRFAASSRRWAVEAEFHVPRSQLRAAGGDDLPQPLHHARLGRHPRARLVDCLVPGGGGAAARRMALGAVPRRARSTTATEAPTRFRCSPRSAGEIGAPQGARANSRLGAGALRRRGGVAPIALNTSVARIAALARRTCDVRGARRSNCGASRSAEGDHVVIAAPSRRRHRRAQPEVNLRELEAAIGIQRLGGASPARSWRAPRHDRNCDKEELVRRRTRAGSASASTSSTVDRARARGGASSRWPSRRTRVDGGAHGGVLGRALAPRWSERSDAAVGVKDSDARGTTRTPPASNPTRSARPRATAARTAHATATSPTRRRGADGDGRRSAPQCRRARGARRRPRGAGGASVRRLR